MLTKKDIGHMKSACNAVRKRLFTRYTALWFFLGFFFKKGKWCSKKDAHFSLICCNFRIFRCDSIFYFQVVSEWVIYTFLWEIFISQFYKMFKIDKFYKIYRFYKFHKNYNIYKIYKFSYRIYESIFEHFSLRKEIAEFSVRVGLISCLPSKEEILRHPPSLPESGTPAVFPGKLPDKILIVIILLLTILAILLTLLTMLTLAILKISLPKEFSSSRQRCFSREITRQNIHCSSCIVIQRHQHAQNNNKYAKELDIIYW